MRNCIRIPKILIPREENSKWSVIACDQFTSDRAYWERVERYVGNAPSTLRFILPEVYLGEDDEARIAEIHENMYRALEEEWVEKLRRGFVFTERTTASGTRRGILACLDLEQYTTGKGEVSPIRSSEEIVPSRLPARVAVRRGAPLEFPHALVFYKDKKNKIAGTLQKCDLELLYEYDLMEDGGHLKGYFIPEDIAAEVAVDLHTRGDPCFAVADGNHSFAAAKAYWEEIKGGLRGEEAENHPARFALVELVNLYDDAVVFHPIHRIVKETDAEALLSLLSSAFKGKREGKVFVPKFSSAAEGVARVDALIEDFVKKCGGSIDYIHGDKELAALAAEEDCVGIRLAAMEKEDFFDALKGGRNLPKKTFSIGEAREKRYYTEGREISYD